MLEGIRYFRRHSKTAQPACPTFDPTAPEFKLDAKGKRLYFGCQCPIWFTARVGDVLIERQSANTRDKHVAQRYAEGIVSGAVMNGVQKPVDVPALVDRGKTVAYCITKHLEGLEKTVGDSTRAMYKLVFETLTKMCSKRGVVYVRDIDIELCEDLKDELGEMQENSRAAYYAKFCAFIAECERKGWIEKRLADRLTLPEFEEVEKEPYSDDEVERLLAAASKHGVMTRLFYELLRDTGLRFSDATKFDPSKLVCGDDGMCVYPYMVTKRKRLARIKKKVHEVYVTAEWRDRLMAARGEWRSALPFQTAVAPKWRDYKRVRETMRQLGDSCGVDGARAHRWRHYFAVRCLTKGMTFDDVSQLLGHSSVSMTQAAYAKWIPARARRLQSVLKAALAS